MRVDGDRLLGPTTTVRQIMAVDTAWRGGHDGADRDDLRTMAHHDDLRTMAHHIVDFIARPHEDLGRAGPVCPFIKGAIRGDLLLLAASPIDEDRHDLLGACTDEMLGTFERMAEAVPNPADRQFASLLVTFPRLRSPGGIAMLARAQQNAKPRFVNCGYMIGEFYPGHPMGGLHDPRFRPLDAAVPALAVRHMHVFDAQFLSGTPAFEAAYLRRFGDRGRARFSAAPSPPGVANGRP